MKKYLLIPLFVFVAHCITAQTYTIGTQTITWTDPARSNRSVGVDFRYPGTNGTLAAGQFPFVIFAHGFSMDQMPYYPYADSLAKRGYIVGLLTTETGLSPSHANFAQDLLFVYGKLISEGNSNNASPFYQKVVAKGAIGGHSMGGGSTVLSAQYGNPQVCSFTFAAATTNPSSISAAHLMTKPYLSFAGSLDCIAPVATHQQPMYDSSGSACKFLIKITGGLHCQYGNANVACSFGEGASGCASSTLTRQQQIDKTLLYLIPYLDYYLKGDCSAWTLFESRYASNTTDVLQRNCTNNIPGNAAITGANSFCQGSSTTLTANPTGFQYLWNDNSIAGTLNVNSVGNYSVVVSNGTCSLAPVSVSVTQALPPATPSAITASDTVCSGISNIAISVVNDIAATNYLWILPSGWGLTSGSNTNALIAISGNTGGTIWVAAQNDCGTSAPVTKAIVVVPSNLGTPGTISGPDLVCNGTSASYAIQPVSGANSYVWSTPNGWSVVTLNPDTAIMFTTGGSSGVVGVSAVNGCGQSVPSTISVTVHDVPVLGILYGQDTVCLNSFFALNFSLSSADDADTIIWSATNPWLITAGQGSSVLSVNSYQSSGTISVYAGNVCGNSQTLSFNVTYVDTPAITITQQDSVLHASVAGATQYQWYADGALLSGATNADYAPTASGNYTVSVTNLYGCTTQSAPFSFIYSSVSDLSAETGFRVFPNPASGMLQVVVNEEAVGGELKIFDAAARMVALSSIKSLHSSIVISSLSAGIYVLNLEAIGKVTRVRVVVNPSLP